MPEPQSSPTLLSRGAIRAGESTWTEKLTSLNDRIAEFVVDRMPDDEGPVELLCIDHNGTYLLPFLCRRISGDWINSRTGERILADVAGWRPRAR